LGKFPKGFFLSLLMNLTTGTPGRRNSLSHYKRFVVKAANALSFAKDFGVTPASLPRIDLDCLDAEVKAAVLAEVLHALEVTEQRVRLTLKTDSSKESLNKVETWLKAANSAVKASKKIWH
jgi:homoserine dehydrogenase